MNILQSIILGIVEGLTEFVPVSSTFHLILASHWLGIPDSSFLKMFEVVVQLGAIFSLIFIYIKRLLENKTLLMNLILSFIPTAIIGKLMYPVIKSIFFTNLNLQIFVFVFVGILILVVENLISKKQLSLSHDLEKLSFRSAILIGLFQALSIIPGVSRSGSIILGMLGLGFTRSSSAEYAFMLSIPTIGAASLLDLYENQALLRSSSSNLTILFFGALAAFISGYIVVKWLTQYLRIHDLKIFAYYRFFLAALLLISFSF